MSEADEMVKAAKIFAAAVASQARVAAMVADNQISEAKGLLRQFRSTDFFQEASSLESTVMHYLNYG